MYMHTLLTVNCKVVLSRINFYYSEFEEAELLVRETNDHQMTYCMYMRRDIPSIRCRLSSLFTSTHLPQYHAIILACLHDLFCGLLLIQFLQQFRILIAIRV